MPLFLRKHQILIIILAILVVVGVGSYTIYSRSFSKSARIETFQTVVTNMDALSNELAAKTAVKEWTAESLGGSAENPEPCSYILNGFNNTFSCIYTIKASFEVPSQAALNATIRDLTKAIGSSRTNAFTEPTPEEGSRTFPDLTGSPDDIASEHDDNQNDSQTAIVTYDIGYQSRMVRCYMTIRFNAFTYAPTSDGKLPKTNGHEMKAEVVCLSR